MTCERKGCRKRRSARAKYCSPACRKIVFNELKAADGLKIVKPKRETPPPARRRNIVEAKAGAEIKPGQMVVKSKCGHIVPAGGRCLQKGCYGVLSKKDLK